MRHIVFTEGRNDVHFVKSLLTSTYGTVDVDDFIVEDYVAEEGAGPTVPPESTEIRRFRAREERGGVLVKSENGYENLLKVFSTVLVDLCDYRLRFSLVVDCDGCGIEEVLDQLNGHVGSRYGGGVTIRQNGMTELNPDATLVNCSVEGSSGLDDEFALVAFADSLEAAADVVRDNDRETKEETIAEFAQETDGFDEFAAVFEHVNDA